MKAKNTTGKYALPVWGVLFLLLPALSLTAQNYLVSFSASGAVSSLDSIRVENITQGTSLTLPGSDTLQLTGTAGLQTIIENPGGVKVCPNPMYWQAEISFFAKKSGNTQLIIYDVSGKEVLVFRDNLLQGKHRYRITGLQQGIYVVGIRGDGYSCASTLISLNDALAGATSEYLGCERYEDDIALSKRGKSLYTMAYTTGDTLHFTGYSGVYSALITAVPTSNINIAFLFASVPSITTAIVSSITANTASSGGNVTSDGGDIVTARGVCWSNTANPVITGNHTTDGSGTGPFTSSISGLNPNSTYYVRAYATNGVGTAYGNEIMFSTTSAPLLAIGDSYQGGIVTYLLLPGDPGYNPSVQHGYIAAPSDQSAGIPWDNGINFATGATATALGTGNANTNTIVGVQGAGNYAAQLCSDLVLNGYSDWYLPSKDELYKMFLNKVAVGGYVSLLYWSSSEFNAGEAWFMSFNSGNQYSYGKNYLTAVRAIRSF